MATAGKVVMQVCEKLGVADEVKRKMKLFPNGYAAMKWLEETRGSELGITQITEILANRAVTYVGPLPGELQSKFLVYSAGLAAKAAQAAAGREFIARLTSPGAKGILKAAGYEFD